MKYLVWLTCFILTFGFSQQNDEQPPYIPPIEFGRKSEADVQLEMHDYLQPPPYIPPIEFGREAEDGDLIMKKLRL